MCYQSMGEILLPCFGLFWCKNGLWLIDCSDFSYIWIWNMVNSYCGLHHICAYCIGIPFRLFAYTIYNHTLYLLRHSKYLLNTVHSNIPTECREIHAGYTLLLKERKKSLSWFTTTAPRQFSSFTAITVTCTAKSRSNIASLYLILNCHSCWLFTLAAMK